MSGVDINPANSIGAWLDYYTNPYNNTNWFTRPPQPMPVNLPPDLIFEIPIYEREERPLVAFDASMVSKAGEGCGFDLGYLDDALARHEVYTKWYRSDVYCSTLKLLEGEVVSVPYDISGPTEAAAADLAIDKEVKMERIITSGSEDSVSAKWTAAPDSKIFIVEIVSMGIGGSIQLRDPKTKQWLPATTASSLREGEIMKVDARSSAILQLKVGSFAYIIEVSGGSELLFLQTLTKDGRPKVILDLGVGDVRIESVGSGKRDFKFEVKTALGVLDVKGTMLFVSVYGKNDKYAKWYTPGTYKTSVTVYEGNVYVAEYSDSGANYKDASLLGAGQKAEKIAKVEGKGK